MEALRKKAVEYLERFGARCFLDHIPYLPVSSTQVRQEVARGGDIGCLVPQAVADYIQRCGLYRSAQRPGEAPPPEFGGSYAHRF